MRARAGIAASTFSDLTSFEATGLPWSEAEAFATAHGIPIVRAGARSLIRTDRWLEGVERASGAEAPASKRRVISDLDRQRATQALRRLGIAVPEPAAGRSR